MKILFAIQGTGNGHLSRAKDVIPALMKRAEVDLLVSGIQADIDLSYEVKYRYKGMSFIFGKKGSVDIYKTIKSTNMRRLYREVKSCPVENYDLVINDFEPVSAWAAKLKGVPCFSLSHQCALLSNKVPQPEHKDRLGWFIIKHYAPVNASYGFHFKRYDENIFTPVIRSEVRQQKVSDNGHITVYLPAYGDEKIIKVLSKIKGTEFEVFSKHTTKSYRSDNVKINKINAELFSQSLATSHGVLCGAGFETPAETLFLGKKLLVIPMKRQYEQHFNAEGLKDIGVPVIPKLSKKYITAVRHWVENDLKIKVDFPDETQFIIDKLIHDYNTLTIVRPEKRRFNLFPKIELIRA
jgi:uncharacterized protein (TIGR00661 family)